MGVLALLISIFKAGFSVWFSAPHVTSRVEICTFLVVTYVSRQAELIVSWAINLYNIVKRVLTPYNPYVLSLFNLFRCSPAQKLKQPLLCFTLTLRFNFKFR